MKAWGNNEKKQMLNKTTTESFEDEFSGVNDVTAMNSSYNKLMYVDTSNEGTYTNTQLMPLNQLRAISKVMNQLSQVDVQVQTLKQ